MIFVQSKSEILKALSRKEQSFAIDFVNMPFYGEEKKPGKHHTNQTTPENQPILRLYYHIPDKKEQTLHSAPEIHTKQRNIKRHHRLLTKRIGERWA